MDTNIRILIATIDFKDGGIIKYLIHDGDLPNSYVEKDDDDIIQIVKDTVEYYCSLSFIDTIELCDVSICDNELYILYNMLIPFDTKIKKGKWLDRNNMGDLDEVVQAMVKVGSERI